MNAPAHRSAPLVRVLGLNKWYGSRQVLSGISFEVAAAERIAICGPSGSGKSTLLRCLNGLETHQSGQILIDGVELRGASINAVRRDVGMVFQAFQLFPHMTVLENCTLAPKWVRHCTAAQAESIAFDLLERVHLADHVHKYPSELSGGEQQRVAIARALCLAPKVMLFDEPTSALDPEMTRQILDIMTDLASTGMTMVCITHEMNFARQVADQMVFMDDGEIVEQGTPAELLDHPKSDRLQRFLKKE